MAPQKPNPTHKDPVMLAYSPRWQMWVSWLEDEHMPPRKRLLEALLHASLPPQLLHQFACDCAARSLQLARSAGVSAPPALHEALETKRRWLNGACSEEDLDRVKHEVTAWGKDKTLALQKQCALSVEWATALEPIAAARYASLHVQLESEYAWQCQHLTTMLHDFLQRRAFFLHRLKHRQLHLAGTLERLQHQLEDALYR